MVQFTEVPNITLQNLNKLGKSDLFTNSFFCHHFTAFIACHFEQCTLTDCILTHIFYYEKTWPSMILEDQLYQGTLTQAKDKDIIDKLGNAMLVLSFSFGIFRSSL